MITAKERELIRLLTPAIKARNLIKFWYNDTTKDFEDWRIIEPVSIGQTKFKAANILLTGWFLPTQQQRIWGHDEKWGNYILDNIHKVEILEQKYGFARLGYNAKDSRMVTIFCAT